MIKRATQRGGSFLFPINQIEQVGPILSQVGLPNSLDGQQFSFGLRTRMGYRPQRVIMEYDIGRQVLLIGGDSSPRSEPLKQVRFFRRRRQLILDFGRLEPCI